MYASRLINIADNIYSLGYDDLRYPKKNTTLNVWEIDKLPALQSYTPKFISALHTQELGSYASCKLHELGIAQHAVIYCTKFKIPGEKKATQPEFKKNQIIYDVVEPKSRWYVRVFERQVYAIKLTPQQLQDVTFHITEQQCDNLHLPDLNDWYKG